MSHPKYVLPVQLALHAAAVHDKRIHSQADTVLNDIGYLAESKFYFVLKRFPAMHFNLKFMGGGEGKEAYIFNAKLKKSSLRCYLYFRIV